MVLSIVSENDKSATEIKSSERVGIPPGDYRLVGWDMDATGRKLIDEICQIAGYTPSSTYAQYVMPFKDLNPAARKRYNIRVVTIGKYRMLKDSKTNKVLKSKSEISALTDFLTWLESVRGDAADGIILVYHEPRKVIPSMLLESLKKFDLLDRFKQTVKGFANGFNVVEAKWTSTVHDFSLRTLSRVMLNKEEELSSAVDRAQLALQIIQHLSTSDENVKGNEGSGSGDSDTTTTRTVELIREFVQSVQDEERVLAELKVVLKRQSNLKPIFGALLSVNRRERRHASPLRRLLAEAGIEYNELQAAWCDGKKAGLEKLIKEKIAAAEDKDVVDLLDVLECHFDPEKKPQLRVEQEKFVKKEVSEVDVSKENNNKNDSSVQSLDTSTPNSPVKETTNSEDAEVAPEAK